MADLNKADEDRIRALERAMAVARAVGIVALTLSALVATGTIWLAVFVGELRGFKEHYAIDIARLERAIERLDDRSDRYKPKSIGTAKMIEGTITRISEDELTLKTGTPPVEMTFGIDELTSVQVRLKPAKLSDLKVGMRVRVKDEDGIAIRIVTVEPPQ